MSDPAKPARRSTPASRRAFLKTLAAGSAAALTAPAFALAAEEKMPKKKAGVKPDAKAAPARPADIEKAVAEQKEYTKKTVATLRAYELETNAEQAFVFAPMKPGKSGGAR